MTNDAQKYEQIFSGTKEVAENLKIEISKLQPWIDANVQGAGAIKTIEQFKGGLREMFILIRESKFRLFIDSVAQHASAALGKKSTICWVKNNPQVLGYVMHDNIVTDAVEDLNSLDFSGNMKPN